MSDPEILQLERQVEWHRERAEQAERDCEELAAVLKSAEYGRLRCYEALYKQSRLRVQAERERDRQIEQHAAAMSEAAEALNRADQAERERDEVAASLQAESDENFGRAAAAESELRELREALRENPCWLPRNRQAEVWDLWRRGQLLGMVITDEYGTEGYVGNRHVFGPGDKDEATREVERIALATPVPREEGDADEPAPGD